MPFRKETDEEFAESRKQARFIGGPGATVSRGSVGYGTDTGYVRSGNPMLMPGYERGSEMERVGMGPATIRAAVESDAPRMDMNMASRSAAEFQKSLSNPTNLTWDAFTNGIPVSPASPPSVARLAVRGIATRGHGAAAMLVADNELLGSTRRPAPGRITAFPPGRPPVTEFRPSSNLARGLGPDVHGTRGKFLNMKLGTPDHFLADPGTGTLAGRSPSRGRPGVPFEEGSPTYEGPASVTGRSGPAFGVHGRPPLKVVEGQWDVIGTPAAVPVDPKSGRPRSYASRRPGDIGVMHGLSPKDIRLIEGHIANRVEWEYLQKNPPPGGGSTASRVPMSPVKQPKKDKEKDTGAVGGPVVSRRVDPREIDTVEPMTPDRPPSARDLAERELLRTAVEKGREIEARRYEEDIKRGMISKREEAKKKDSTKNK